MSFAEIIKLWGSGSNENDSPVRKIKSFYALSRKLNHIESQKTFLTKCKNHSVFPKKFDSQYRLDLFQYSDHCHLKKLL